MDRRVRDGEIVLDEFAIFLLNSEAVRGHKRKMFKRSRQVEVLDRVRRQFPLRPGLNVQTSVEALPDHLQDLLCGQSLWRVEWILRGMTVAICSNDWRFSWCEPLRNLSTKFVEMGGFCDWTVMLRIWSDSLVHPDRTIYKEGMGYTEEHGMRMQKASMISHVYDYDHVVSAVVIQRL